MTAHRFVLKKQETNMSTAASTPATVAALVKQLEALGLESYRNTMRKHGAQEPIFGVKIDEMKKLMKLLMQY